MDIAEEVKKIPRFQISLCWNVKEKYKNRISTLPSPHLLGSDDAGDDDDDEDFESVDEGASSNRATTSKRKNNKWYSLKGEKKWEQQQRNVVVGQSLEKCLRSVWKTPKFPKKSRVVLKKWYFLRGKNSCTKCFIPQTGSYPRLTTLAFDINNNWCVDVAYVDKTALPNGGVKFLLVCVDVLSRYLRVETLKSLPSVAMKNGLVAMLNVK